LKAGGTNVLNITKIAFMHHEDMLTGSNLKIYNAAIKVLYNTLKTANVNAGDCRDKLEALTTELKGIAAVMG